MPSVDGNQAREDITSEKDCSEASPPDQRLLTSVDVHDEESAESGLSDSGANLNGSCKIATISWKYIYAVS